MKAYRYWSQKHPVFYVAGVKGDVGDWEYTTDHKKAIDLTLKQMQRFSADCRKAGVRPHFFYDDTATATNGDSHD